MDCIMWVYMKWGKSRAVKWVGVFFPSDGLMWDDHNGKDIL